jgi:hypothetical protein
MQLLNQQRLEVLKAAFPPAPAGWQADEVNANTAPGLLVAGLHLDREYYNDNASLSLKVTLDSPTIMSMAAVYANPAMVTATGGRIKKVAGQNVVLTGKGQELEAIVLIDNRIMLNASIRGAAESVLLDFLKTVDFKKLASQ